MRKPAAWDLVLERMRPRGTPGPWGPVGLGCPRLRLSVELFFSGGGDFQN